MWRALVSIWNGINELLDIPRREDQTWREWITGQFMVISIMMLIIGFNFKEFVNDYKEEQKSMFKECTVCRDVYDLSTLSYPLVHYFCLRCIKDITPQGQVLIEKFQDWAYKQTDKTGRSISNNDVTGIVLSVFYAIKNKAPREPLFDALVKFTWDNVGDTVTLSELLEELTALQENKLKPLKGNTDVCLE